MIRTTPGSHCTLTTFTAIAFLAGSVAIAQAQDEPSPGVSASPEEIEEMAPVGGREFRFEFGLLGGGHFFSAEHGLGRAQNDPQDLSPMHNVSFGGRLTLNFNPRWALEGEALLTPTFTRDEATRLWVAAYRGNLLFNIIPTGRFRPFLAAGFGGVTSVVDDEAVVPSDTDSALHFGLGAKALLRDNIGLRLDARILAPPSLASDVVAIGEETRFGGPDFEAMLSIYVAFGEVPRARSFVKREVVVVKEKEPNPDPDGDGIAGAADKCPYHAEDKDGFQDDDGCPDPDNDGDGIPDAQDKCPNEAETVNGIDDEDGCPEVDTDGDGILGSRDKCPDQPETFNNYQDEDGCPDEVPAAVKKYTGVIQGINFKTKSAQILRGSFVILNRAVEVLKEYSDVKLEIAGHTDDRGSADFNRDLSQNRAEAVKAYLVSKGIDESRLQAVGYGLDRPIANNKTSSGRSKNRRTEFQLIKN
jgi:OmpA-OmpF porin, OOP family